MKTTRNITVTAALIIIACIKGFAALNLPFEPITNGNMREVPVRAAFNSTGANRNSFIRIHSSSNITGLNIHASAGSSNSASFLDRLGINAGTINRGNHFLGCPYSNGVVVSTRVKYSALMSIACVWDISWGAKSAMHNQQNARTNNVNIVLIMSNPAPGSNQPSPFMHKLETNVSLSMLSIVEVVVTFGHI